MHEFDKCRFCLRFNPNALGRDHCMYPYLCERQIGFDLDVTKLIEKAKFYDISVSDVLSIMHEVTK